MPAIVHHPNGVLKTACRLTVTRWCIRRKVLYVYTSQCVTRIYLAMFYKHTPRNVLHVITPRCVTRVYLPKCYAYIPRKVLLVYTSQSVTRMYLAMCFTYTPRNVLHVFTLRGVTRVYLTEALHVNTKKLLWYTNITDSIYMIHVNPSEEEACALQSGMRLRIAVCRCVLWCVSYAYVGCSLGPVLITNIVIF